MALANGFSYTRRMAGIGRSAALLVLALAFLGPAAQAQTVSCTPTTGPVEVGVAYSTTCSTTPPAANPWVISAGAVPSGINSPLIAGVSTTISGTPTTSGAYSFTVYQVGAVVAEAFSGTIAAAVSFTCTNNGIPIKILWPYTTTCTVSGGVSPYNWSISSGALPAGVTGPSPGTGTATTISGTPTGVPQGGTPTTYTLTVVDGAGAYSSQTFNNNGNPINPGSIAGPNPRTWVSSSGNDANLCLEAYPCRTFAVALQSTLRLGEIDAQSAGDFGPVNITYGVTIDGGGLGSISSAIAPPCYPNPAIICAVGGGTDTVTLRNLSLTVGTGSVGIFTIGFGFLQLEHVSITGAPSMLYGVEVFSGNVSLNDVRVQNANDSGAAAVYALATGPGPKLSISDSSMTHNATGLLVSGSGVVAQVQNCVLAFNGVGVSSTASATVRLSNDTIMNNTLGLQTAGGGTLISFGNNNIFGNTTNGSPTGTTTLK